MMKKEEIQEWIDGEERARATDIAYQGYYRAYSLAWSDGLKFALRHNENEVLQELEEAKKGDIDNSLSDAGYYKALKMVVNYSEICKGEVNQ